jgi:hypothetical protein
MSLFFYEYDSNSIHAEPIKNRTAGELKRAYSTIVELLKSRGLHPHLQILDNEATKLLVDYITSQGIDYQLAPPHVHRRNAAEHAISTYKDHFIAGLCSTDKDYLLELWDKLIPQSVITLNLLRCSRINPQLSAYAQVFGALDFNKTPLAPPGTRVLVHEKPIVRQSWDPRAIDAWYIGPAMKHYRCYRVWIWNTRNERVADTLAWFPTLVVMPTLSSLDLALAAAKDLVKALQHPFAGSPLAPTTDSQTAALKQLADIFQDCTKRSPLLQANADKSNNKEVQNAAANQEVQCEPAGVLRLPVSVLHDSPGGAIPRVETEVHRDPTGAVPRVDPVNGPSMHPTTAPTPSPTTTPSPNTRSKGTATQTISATPPRVVPLTPTAPTAHVPTAPTTAAPATVPTYDGTAKGSTRRRRR